LEHGDQEDHEASLGKKKNVNEISSQLYQRYKWENCGLGQPMGKQKQKTKASDPI
jgi:hypothetical protein